MNIIKSWFDKICRKYLDNELEELTYLRTEKRLYSNFSLELQELRTNKNAGIKKEEILNEQIERLKDMVMTNGWENPHGWKTFNPNYVTINNLKVQPNTFIIKKDKELKRVLINKGFHKLTFEKLIWKLEEWIYSYVRYVSDPLNKEDWRSSAYIFKKRQDDCDGHALLYQSCMEILGFADSCICKVNGVSRDGNEFNHMYNKVLMNSEWIIVDPTYPRKIRKYGVWKYDIIKLGLNWFFNSYGTYKSEEI